MSYFGAMRKTLGCALALAAFPILADQVVMQNGDRFSGHVLSLSAESVVLQNENLGKITVPRAKVSLLSLGDAPALAQTAAATAPSIAMPTNQAAVNPHTINVTNSNDIAKALRSLGANTNFIEQIRGQFLADASPEANQQFNDTLGGLMSGKVDMQGLRAQAKSAADQLRAYQKELGPEAGDEFNTYLTILDNFLKQTK